MKHQVIVRQFHQNDLDELMNTWEEANRIAHPFLNEEYIAQVRKDIPACYIPNADTWVAELNNQVVGFMSLIENEIGAIFVLPKYHGGGIGVALMNRAQQLHSELEVEVFRLNKIGRAFYKKYGFRLLCEKAHEPSGQRVLRLQYNSIS